MATRTFTVRMDGEHRGLVRSVKESEKELGGLDRKLRDSQGRFVKLGADVHAFGDETKKSSKAVAELGAMSDKNKSKLAGMGKAIAGAFAPVTKVKSIATLAAVGGTQIASALGASLIGGLKKAVHGAGAVLALLPAIAATGVLAFATVKIAVQGVGDALTAGFSGDAKEFQASLEGLSPAARGFAREVVGLKDEFDRFKRSVQERFFAPFKGDIADLAGQWLPALRDQMTGVASTFGRTVHELAGFLALPPTVMRLAGAFSNGRQAIDNLASGVVNLMRAFVPLISVGSTFLPGLTGGFEGATLRLAEFMEAAERTGRLRGWIQAGLDKLMELWETAKQIGRIFRNLADIGQRVFETLNITPSGGWLDLLEGATAAFRNFLDTARGSEAIERVLSILSSLFGGLLDIAVRLGKTLAVVFAPLLPDLEKAINAFSGFKTAVLNTGIDVLTPVLVLLAAVLGGVVLPAATKVFEFLSKQPGVTRALGIAIAALLIPSLVMLAVHFTATQVAAVRAGIAHSVASAKVIASWVAAAASSVVSAGVIAARWAFMAAQATISAAKTALAWTVGHVAGAASAVASTVAAAAVVVAKWVWMAVQSMLSAVKCALAWTIGHVTPAAAAVASMIVAAGIMVAKWAWMGVMSLVAAAKMALAWIIALGPIAWAIALIILIAGIVIYHWETIKNKTLWAWGIITGKVGEAWTWMKETVGGAVDWISTKISDVWGGISDTVGNVWDTVKRVTRDKLNSIIGIINGLIRGVNRVLSWIPGVSDAAIPDIGLIGGVGVGGGGGSHQMASGGSVPPFVTNGARAIVGEGDPRYPEYVIPTDPKYRRRAQGLAAQAASKVGVLGYQGGGVMGDGIISATGIPGFSGIDVGAIASGVASVAFEPFYRAAMSAADRIDWALPKGIAKFGATKFRDFIKRKDDEAMAAGANTGGGGSAKGLVGYAASAYGFFRRMFPNMTIGGWRATGSVPGSDHPKGKALDLMTGSGAVAGRIINAALHETPGSKYWIWNRQIAQQSGGWRPRHYSGPSPHTDHVHLSYYKRGGVMRRYHEGGTLPEDVMGIGPSGARYSLQKGEGVTPARGGAGPQVLVQNTFNITNTGEPRDSALRAAVLEAVEAHDAELLAAIARELRTRRS